MFTTLLLGLVGSTLAQPNVTELVRPTTPAPNESLEAIKHCYPRGGCTCDCSWANPSTCGSDDSSCCWLCCCGGGPTPSPTPAPSPGPNPGLTKYCPSANDFTVAYRTSDPLPVLNNQGYQIQGGGAVATKAAYNLLGGSVEFDISFAGVHTGVNANIYTISPSIGSGGFSQNNYCDGAKTGSGWCLEVDWIESNGNCGGASTLHTVPGPGSVGCTQWGCQKEYMYNGTPTFHMKITYNTDGTWNTFRDGRDIGALRPAPRAQDISILKQAYQSKGGVIYSSQWTGWVPVSRCGTSGDLHSSYFEVKNLVITGQVVQGPQPTRC